MPTKPTGELDELRRRVARVEDRMRTLDYRIRHELHLLLREVRGAFDLDEREDPDEFASFLAEHPELTEPATVGELSDERVLAALEQACVEWGRETTGHGHAFSNCVAQVLAGGSALDHRVRLEHGDVIRVGLWLGRLAREGRVERIQAVGDRAAKWRPSR